MLQCLKPVCHASLKAKGFWATSAYIDLFGRLPEGKTLFGADIDRVRYGVKEELKKEGFKFSLQNNPLSGGNF